MDGSPFGNWLKNERELRGWSQSKIEHAAKMGHSQYSKLETGKIPRPLKDTRDRLHHVLGTSDEDLVHARILHKRPVRSTDGSRSAVIYEYVDDAPTTRQVCETTPAYDVPTGDIPDEVLVELRQVRWTPDTTRSAVLLFGALARASDRPTEAEPDPSPDQSHPLPAVPDPDAP